MEQWGKGVVVVEWSNGVSEIHHEMQLFCVNKNTFGSCSKFDQFKISKEFRSYNQLGYQSISLSQNKVKFYIDTREKTFLV